MLVSAIRFRLEPLSQPFKYQGRLRRVPFWCSSLIFYTLFTILKNTFGGSLPEPLEILAAFAYPVPWTIRRMRDTGIRDLFIYAPMVCISLIAALSRWPGYTSFGLTPLALNGFLLPVFLFVLVNCLNHSAEPPLE